MRSNVARTAARGRPSWYEPRIEAAERQQEIDGTSLLWRESPARGPAPVLYLHGVPTDGADWLPFLARTGGYAPDLPGFGRSGKPPHFDYSVEGYAHFLLAFVNSLGLERVSIVAHDWGAVGLGLAQLVPDRIERVVLIDAVPLLPGYRWHRLARLWQTPIAGELLMGFSSRWATRRLSRGFLAADGPAPRELVDRIWSHFDQGTQRAILKLYRSATHDDLVAAGERLGTVPAPALVVWGADDPYLPASFAHAYAERLGGQAVVEVVEGARHWPWLDRPELVERIAGFLTSA